MIPAAICGALICGGLVLVWAGLHPQPEPLAALLGRLGRVNAPASVSTGERVSRVGERLERTDYGQRYLDRLAVDLRVVGRPPGDEMTALAVMVIMGAVAPLGVAVLAAALAGVILPPAIVLVLMPLLALVAGLHHVVGVRRAAARRREEFLAALSGFCDLSGMNLAAGRGVTGALESASGLGAGWAFTEIRAALVAARERGLPPAEGLDRLGSDLDIDDLKEVAGSIRQAGTNGAAVRTTLANKAHTIRSRITAKAESRAAQVTERLSLPAVAVLMGLVAFFIYPVLTTLLNP